MPGPSSVNTNNTSLFDAFKQLTVGREMNRGTLEAVKKDGKVVELKCSQHHFYSGEVKVSQQDAQDLRALLKTAVYETIDMEFGRITGSFIVDRGLEDEQVGKLFALKKDLVDALDQRFGITGDTRLLRSDIEKVIANVQVVVDELKGMSVENLQKVEPKDLLDVLDAPQRLDEIEQAWDKEHPGRKFSGQRVVDLCRNQEYVKYATLLWKHDITLCSAKSGKVGDKPSQGAPKGGKFEVAQGSSAAVLKQCAEKYRDNATAVLIFGDSSHHGGYITGSGQEEDMTQCATARSMAAFVGMGYTKPSEVDKVINFTLNEIGLANAPASNGILSKNVIDNIGGKALAQELIARYMDMAAPSFSPSFSSTDLSGSNQWMWDAREILGTAKTDVATMTPEEKTQTAKEVANSKNFINTFFAFQFGQKWGDQGETVALTAEEKTKYGEMKTRAGLEGQMNEWGIEKSEVRANKKLNQGFLKVSRGQEMMRCITFAADKLREKGIDVFDDDTDAQMEKLLKLVATGEYKEILDEANKNYAAVLERKFDDMLGALERVGVKRLVGGPIGCGFFCNDDKVVAKAFANAVARHNVDFIFASYDGEAKDGHLPFWKEAFQTKSAAPAKPAAPAVSPEMFDVQTGYELKELGAKTSKKYQFKKPNGRLVFNRDAIKQDMELYCKGKNLREKFAFALNLFSEKSPGFKHRDDEQRDEYLSVLPYLAGDLADEKIATPTSMNLRLYDTMHTYGNPRLNGELYDELADFLSTVADVIKAG